MYNSNIFFYIVPILFNTFRPAVHKLLYAHRKKCFQLSDMHRFFHYMVAGKMAASQSVFEWPKQVIVRRSQIRTMWRMLQDKVQLAQAFNAVDSSVCTDIIVQNCDTSDYSPQHLGQTVGFNQSQSISL
jgi:hypothetical protein